MDDNLFSLELCIKDIEHLEKFSRFMEYKGEIKKDSIRCRFYVRNKHLKEVLNSYGCVPRKSLILEFPDENIFKSKHLIRHFIRGYFDGDGCISYNTKDHLSMNMSVLGTEIFLNKAKKYISPNFEYKLGYNNKNQSEITRSLQINGKNGLKALYYLYDSSIIYLNRKYNKYLEYCRLYEKSYRELQTNNGEDCDVNPVITTETKESVAS